MARDRKKAKQRQRAAARDRGGALPAPTQPVHENVPGSLEHASGEVEEFDAALVAGAGGVPAEPEVGEAPAEPGFDEQTERGGEGEATPTAAGPPERPSARPPAGGPRPEGNRVANFLRASWAELQRVQWPDRRQVAQATGVVLGFVAIAGAYLGLADYVAQKIVDAIL